MVRTMTTTSLTLPSFTRCATSASVGSLPSFLAAGKWSLALYTVALALSPPWAILLLTVAGVGRGAQEKGARKRTKRCTVALVRLLKVDL